MMKLSSIFHKISLIFSVSCSVQVFGVFGSSGTSLQPMTCPPGYVFNAARTDCLEAAIAYGDECLETAQCYEFLSAGGTCTNGTCNCANGYHYLNGFCGKSSGLGESCLVDDDCYANADFEALSCTGGVCTCSRGFYQREYRTCRRAGTAIGDDCVIDLDCRFGDGARCDQKSGCYQAPKLAGHSNESESSNVALSNPRERREVDARQFSQPNCTTDRDCSHFGSSVCTHTRKCVCNHGYGFDSKMENCIPELGMLCSSGDKAKINYSTCRNGRWSCEGARVPSKDNLVCRKVTTRINSSCQFDEQCYIFGPDSYCRDKQCVCNGNSHYAEDEMFCWQNKGIGEICTKDIDCHVPKFNSKLICNKENVCSCPAGTHINAAKSACIDDNPVIGGACSADVDCKSLINVRCANETCVCDENYFQLSGKCVVGINAPCESDLDCKTINSTCVSKACRCMNGLVSPSPDICIPISPFGGACSYDVQCSSSVTDARCLKTEVAASMQIEVNSRTTGVCDCDAGHHRRYEKCYLTRVLDETCRSRGECYVTSDPASVYCLRGVCACDFDARRINSTFCQNDASNKLVFSSLLISSLLFTTIFSR